MLPKCDQETEDALTAQLFAVGQLWAQSPYRPRPSETVVRLWNDLILDWSRSSDLPFLVRKTIRGYEKGAVVKHESGRLLVPCDNSPAQWAFSLAMRGECPSLNALRDLLNSDQVPMAMVKTGCGIDNRKFKRTLADLPGVNVNKQGWKLAHVETVGLKTRAAIESVQIDKIAEHFSRLMSPANMFLVPLASAGFSETIGALKAFAKR